MEESWLSHVQMMIPDTPVLTFDQVKARGVITITCDIYCSDVEPLGSLAPWSIVGKAIVTTRAARRVPESWQSRSVQVSHVECGGVTDGTWRINIYTPKVFGSSQANNRDHPVDLSPSSRRDLRSVLDRTVSRGLPCAAPASIADTDPPKVTFVRNNIIHGGGLFPYQKRTLYVVAPNTVSTTGWCRRHLTAEELLHVLDVPSQEIMRLKSEMKKKVCADETMVPAKVTLAVVRGLQCMASAVSSDQLALTDETFAGAVGSTTTESFPHKLDGIGGSSGPAVKATKSDDAVIPVHLWNSRIAQAFGFGNSEGFAQKLELIRIALLRAWRRRVARDFRQWYQRLRPSADLISTAAVVTRQRGTYVWCKGGRPRYTKYWRDLANVSRKDWIAGADCIGRSSDATWWEWDQGSRPLFWRWPKEYVPSIRDGLPLWFKAPMPQWRVPQRSEKDPRVWSAMRKKLQAVREKGYLKPGTVKSLTSFFAVPKGENDIRMVYDGTKSGLNGVLWAPWFPLPTIDHHLRAVLPGYWMGDIDIGEMFLNFMLHERVQPYCGVDLTTMYPEEVEAAQVCWERWGRCGMGFTTSPYQCVQGVLWAEEVILGDPGDPQNIFAWDDVELNLPGCEDYDPSRPWVAKVRSKDKLVANDLFIYVDDLRTVGASEEECYQASRRTGSKLNWLGLQDAARKRRPPSQTPGAWAGSIVDAGNDGVSVLISEERWSKTKQLLDWVNQNMQDSSGIPFKELEKYRGFLIYVSRTYPEMTPYLKGIHLTLDSWRPWRKDDGWKLTSKEMRATLSEMGCPEETYGNYNANAKPPTRVQGVPRLQHDIRALLELFEGNEVVRRQVRLSKMAVARYGFGDASGQGFGSTLQLDDRILYRYGQWASHVSDESSNFRELTNLVLAIEEAYDEGVLRETELFMFTDNSPAESAYYKGTSSSLKLFELVLRLRKLQMKGDLRIHLVHVSGKRMIAEGTDGLSRGDLSEGVMGGARLLDFVPLHKCALEREPELLDWVCSWSEYTAARILSPKDWFSRGQRESRCIWMPPPAAAETALEMLGKAIHKRPRTEHIIIIPRLMTSRWRKLLGKICDLVFCVPVGCDAWSDSQFEPLIVGIYCPLFCHRPWRLRRTRYVEHVEGMLREMPSTQPFWGRNILCEFLVNARRLDSLPELVVWRMLQGSLKTVPKDSADG